MNLEISNLFSSYFHIFAKIALPEAIATPGNYGDDNN